MIVVFLYQLYALARAVSAYRREFAAGLKTVRTVLVKDKQVVRRRGERYVLVASMEQVEVKKELYEQVDVGDQIEISTSIISHQLLGVAAI